MAAHSSTLTWKTPWTEEPGRLQSMGSLRVGHDWATSLSFFTFMHWRRKWQPIPMFLPGKSHGQRSLVCCSPWGRRVGHDWAHTYTYIIFKLHCKELEDLTLSYIGSAQDCTVLRISRTYPFSDVLYYVMMIIRLMKLIILPEICD